MPFYFVSGRSVISHEHPQWALVIGTAQGHVQGSPSSLPREGLTSLADSLGKDDAGGYVTSRRGGRGHGPRCPPGLKRRDDPDNLFRLNHNISPADG
jgi:hypothetical protein